MKGSKKPRKREFGFKLSNEPSSIILLFPKLVYRKEYDLKNDFS